MKRIGIFTTTRADFGVYAPLLERLRREPAIETLLFAGGTHLAPEHGRTITEVERVLAPADTFDFFLNDDSEHSLCRATGIESLELARIFREHPMDAVVLLGDRFEMLPIALAAILHRRIIVHLFGGEISEGALDEQIRHMLTKAAHVHCVSCEEYRANVISLGEEPHRVHVTGTLAADTMHRLERIPRAELFHDLDLDPALPTIMLTHHPVTLDAGMDAGMQMENIFDALAGSGLQVVITAPNIDRDREAIMAVIRRRMAGLPGSRFVPSLGYVRFHSLMPHLEFVLGNSSSGVAEVPFYRIPTVNIGTRQKGRVRHASVIDCGQEVDAIRAAIARARDAAFRAPLADMPFAFGDGTAAERICAILRDLDTSDAAKIKRLIQRDDR